MLMSNSFEIWLLWHKVASCVESSKSLLLLEAVHTCFIISLPGFYVNMQIDVLALTPRILSLISYMTLAVKKKLNLKTKNLQELHCPFKHKKSFFVNHQLECSETVHYILEQRKYLCFCNDKAVFIYFCFLNANRGTNLKENNDSNLHSQCMQNCSDVTITETMRRSH